MGSGWFIKKVNHSIENLKNRRGFQIRIRNLNVCFINPLLIDIMYIIWEIIWITHIIVTRIQGTFPTVLCNKFCDFAKFRVSFQLDDFVFKVGASFACQENQKRQFFTKTLAFNFGCRKNPMPFFCFLIHGSFKWQSVGCFWVPRDSGIRWRWWQNNLEFSNFEWRCCCWAKGTVYDHNQSSCTWDSTPNWCAGRNNGPWRSRPFGWRSFRTRSSAGRSGDRTWKFITWFAGCWDPPFVDRIFVSPCCRSLRCWGRWFQNVAFQGSASDRTRPTSIPTNVCSSCCSGWPRCFGCPIGWRSRLSGWDCDQSGTDHRQGHTCHTMYCWESHGQSRLVVSSALQSSAVPHCGEQGCGTWEMG